MKEQIDNSILIVEGEVFSQSSFWSNNLIYTSNTIKVYKVFKGKLESKNVDVITLGGTVGLEALIVSSSLKLKKGNVGVFMLESSQVITKSVTKSLNQKFKTYSALQGFYRYNLYDDLVVNPFNKTSGISSNFYNELMYITKEKYVEVSAYNTIKFKKASSQSKILSPVITSFSPTTATAGTKTEITINGSGFGTSGEVGFSDANEGGLAFFVDALDTQVVSWTDTQIIVEVPSTAGTGKIRVKDAASVKIESTTDLTISYSESNVEYDPGSGIQAYPVQHYEQSFITGGYVWTMQTDFFNDTEKPGARVAFERALESWRCNTKVNWTIKNNGTATDVVSSDGTNVIRFDNGNELDSGVLGVCYSWYSAPSCSLPNPQWYVSGLDIVFDDAISWYFGTGTPSGSQYDFESVALHELGHGHQLGHVINSNAVMHYSMGISEYNRVLSNDDIEAGVNVQTRSTTNPICNLELMTDYDTSSCSLSVEEGEFEKAIILYPNPTREELFIKNKSFINLEKAVIYDISGRQIVECDISDSSQTKIISLSGFSKGIYFVNIYSESLFITKKIILE
ncbi:T9SS type A sorting domain-containing protein [Flaviramulus basaltis]|uniref:T9SS type A sorting domain-containing protein n=1 Tax=Flaviramulus basaltis TaxID=369401 RepID=UPI0015C544BD|nr:T9SS type A sorting domain-containing protein [Flaviramulus basaltis]